LSKNTTNILNKNWKDILIAIRDGESMRSVAKKYGVKHQTISARLWKKDAQSDRDFITSKRKATRNTKGFSVKGISTYYDKKGNVTGQWVKEDKLKEDYLEIFNKTTADLVKKIKPVKNIQVDSTIYSENTLLTNYLLVDMHLGLLAHKDETTKNVDSKIVYKNTLTAMELLINNSPSSETAIISDLGDTLHSSDDANRSKSGHILDVDGRHYKLFSMAVQLKIKMIEMALKKHKKVKYIAVAGNHSELVTIYIKAVLQAKFANEPRFEIEMSNAIHQYHKFGKTLLGYTHQHTTKASRLPEIMMIDNIDIVSETKYRYFHCGHFHHTKVIDNPLCFVENHRNLTDNDYYSQSAGFRTNKEMKSITYHKDYGEWCRNTVPLTLVEDYLEGLYKT